MSGILRVTVVVTFYFITSISLVLLNKYMFSSRSINMDAPLFLTWTQLLVAAIFCRILSSLRTHPGISLLSFPPFDYHLSDAIAILPLTLIFCGMVVFNNLCLKHVEVSFYQVARALTLVFNIIFSYLFLRERTSFRALVACTIVVIGYLLGCEGEIHYSTAGVIFGVASSACVCAYSIAVRNVMSYPFLQRDSWRLMIYTNVNGVFIMPIIFLFAGEGHAIMNSPALYSSYFWLITLITGSMGFLLNISTFLQIKHTSPLTHNVSGTAKACVQTVIGLMIYGNPMSLNTGIGTAMSTVGCALYAAVRTQEMQQRQKIEKELEKSGNVSEKEKSL